MIKKKSMDNKKLGLIIIGISILLIIFVYGIGNQLKNLQANSSITNSCTNICKDICTGNEPSYFIYGSIAVIFSTLSLGIYLFFFEKSHQTLINKIKKDSNIKSSSEKFNLILLGLNEDEKNILTAVKDQDGITQHTLGLRTNMHKSKLSIIVGMLEQKGLVKREKKGKTNQVYLKVNLNETDNER